MPDAHTNYALQLRAFVEIGENAEQTVYRR